MAQRRGRYIVILLLVLMGLSSWRTLTSERARHRIAGDFQQAQEVIAQLQEERSTLAAELGGARQTITSHEATITSLQQELQLVSTKLDDTAIQLAALRQDHEQLQQEHQTMAGDMQALETQKVALEQRLSSLKELRLAIRDVKHHLWLQRLASWQARINTQNELDHQQLAAGNRGYVIRKGQSTLGATTKLQVHVLEPESQ
jgi:chromosome segregation ATPase